jgi:NADH dehydrogenase
VAEVTPEKVIVTIKDGKDKDAKPVTKEIPAGFVLWSTGIGECNHDPLESGVLILY